MKTLALRVPDELYEALEDTRAMSGGTMEEIALRWLTQRAPSLRAVSADEEREAARGLVTRYFGAWDSGDPNFADNDRIDADLTREYGSTHEEAT